MGTRGAKICAGVAVAMLVPALARGAEPASTSSERASYWGDLPAPTDSTTAQFNERPMPLGEAFLVWPYRVLTYPIYLLYEGIHHAVLFTLPVAERIIAQFSGPGFPVLIRPTFGYGTGSGFGGGLEARSPNTFASGDEVRFRAEASTRDERRVTLGYRNAGTNGFQLGAGHRLEPYSRFYGLGPESRPEDESFYTLELNWAGISASQPLFEHVVLTGELLYSAVGARAPGTKETPPIQDVFPSTPRGFGETSDGMSLGLSLSRGTVNQDGRPERGSLRRLKATRFESIGEGEPSFWQFRADFQDFVPLWFDRRALALRGVASWIDVQSGDDVAFPRLLSNDEPDLFRGYQDFRFHDTGLLLGTVEYRWPIWADKEQVASGLDAYLFAEVGQVFGSEDEISFDHLRASYGFGVRLLGKREFLTRMEFAWSEEGFQFRLSGHQVLQFTRGDLYHGRNPVPFR